MIELLPKFERVRLKAFNDLSQRRSDLFPKAFLFRSSKKLHNAICDGLRAYDAEGELFVRHSLFPFHLIQPSQNLLYRNALRFVKRLKVLVWEFSTHTSVDRLSVIIAFGLDCCQSLPQLVTLGLDRMKPVRQLRALRA